jgi:hypothetical protein
MRDWWNANVTDNLPGPIKTLADHNRWTTLASVLACIWLFIGGCSILKDPTVPGVFGTTQPVTRGELAAQAKAWQFDYEARQIAMEAEAKAMVQKFSDAAVELDVKDSRRQEYFGAITNAIGAIPGYGQLILGLALPALTIFAGGTLADNGRKGAILVNRPASMEKVRTGEPEPPA